MNGEKFLAKRFQNKEETTFKSIDEADKAKIINLGIGDLDVHTDEIIINSAFKDALNGHTHYTDPLGDLELRQEIINYHKSEFTNYNVNLDEVIVLSGACHGMYLALQATLNPGDEVIVIAPFFPVYLDQIKEANGTPVIVHTTIENNYQILKEDLEKAISSKTKGIIINTPSNPTGVCYSLKSLEIVADLAKKYDLLIYADDIYDFYDYSDSFIPIYTLEGMKERTISVCSFSKNFAMTGWRVGYNIGPSSVIETIRKINEVIVYSASSISQRAALAALKNRDHIKNSVVPLYKERVEYSLERINNIPGLKAFPPQGGIYLFIDISETNLNSIEYSNYLFDELKVKVIPGKPFGDDNAIRIACSNSLETLKEAFDRIEKKYPL
ncbi:aminotransferase class I/II-fold pyridoxal phosphate-dependent enzyme [Candidatus Cetobacterium colombiensis]|uniref:Aminotransferase n=1 Tax=Candidatus Cetobacterium colombiensis TaxID=3073100 RepID=A0ABU4WAC9_9FUSO|nr:aminotransferase class I/II-fold pyridoxal phosphate-dependent enzyme [Candidatus Cetobacterium colombiensis]MDX8335977.1 aminotransferase class I/II-fold pyridoxal phosphate-dependent enzyme [Candidatus Cetobacterium colombiensis]